MSDWIRSALALYRAQEPFVIATLWSVSGASPDQTGARVLVSPHGLWGKFNSSHRTEKIVAHCRRLLNDETNDTLADYPLGEVAGVANGSYRIVYAVCPVNHPPIWLSDANRHMNDQTPVVLAHSIDSNNIRTPSRFTLYAKHDQPGLSGAVATATGKLLHGNHNLNNEIINTGPTEQILLEKIGESSHSIAVVGDSRVTHHLLQQLRLLPVNVCWLTDNNATEEAGFTRRNMNDASFSMLRKNTRVVVATGDHDKDFHFCKLALNQPDFSYIGCLGSTKKAQVIKARLISHGIPEARVNDLRMPIGLACIVGKQPEIVAASIVGQLLSL